MAITTSKTEKQLFVKSPFNPDLPAKVRLLGGKWDNNSWVFDIRDEQRVKELYENIYGYYDGEMAPDAVTARVTCGDDVYTGKGSIFFGGRQVARATGRDSGATLGGGIIVLKGGFSSGGSAKNWATVARPGTVFEVRDLPLKKVEEEKGDSDWVTIEIVGGEKSEEEILLAEKQKLLERIAEIDNILAK